MREQTRIEGLVDVHAHVVIKDYMTAARAAGHLLPDGMPGWPRSDSATHLIDTAGLLNRHPPRADRAARALCQQVNDAGADVARAHPRRFGNFASLPLPDVEGALTEAPRP